MSEATHLTRVLTGLFANRRSGWFPPFAEAVDGLTAIQASWRPQDGMHSIWEIVNHVRFHHDVVRLRLQHQPVDRVALGAADGWPPAGDPFSEDAWSAACDQALTANTDLAAVIAAFSSEDLDRPIREAGPTAWQVVHGVIAHNAYHTAQIVMLRRLQGCWVVDWRARQQVHG